jgi:hypothetical protein
MTEFNLEDDGTFQKLVADLRARNYKMRTRFAAPAPAQLHARPRCASGKAPVAATRADERERVGVGTDG